MSTVVPRMLRRRDAWLQDLASVPAFAGCSRRDLAKVARHIDHLRFDAGSTVVRQGGPGHELFVISEGTVEVERDGRIVATMGPGDHFGEMAILDSAPRDATVRALSPLRVMVISAASARELMAEIPGLRDAFVAMNESRRRN